MADITNLEQFLTDVATSIKNKKGTTDAIPAANFDTEIESIPTGTVVETVVAEASTIVEDETAVIIDSAPIEEPVVIPENGVAEVVVPKTVLAESIGLTCDKIIAGETILDIEGTAESSTTAGDSDLIVMSSFSGETSTLENSVEGGLIKNFRLVGNTVQDGTPTPEIPINIYSNSGNIEIKVTNEENEQTITFPLGSQILRKGDYLADDGIHITKTVVTFNGTEDWNLTVNNEIPCFWMGNHSITGVLNVAHDKKCTHFPYTSLTFPNASVNTLCENTASAMFIFKTDVATTIDEWTTWLSSNNISVVCGLATEEIIAYNTAQQAAWDNIKKLLTYDGITTITTTNAIKPTLSGEYYKITDTMGKGSFVGEDVILTHTIDDGAIEDFGLEGKSVISDTLTMGNVTGTVEVLVTNGTDNQTVTFPFGSQVLRKYDFLADDGIHIRTKQVILDGTETWTFYTTKTSTFRTSLSIPSHNGVCTHYENIQGANFDISNGIYLATSNMAIISDTRFTTVEDFTAYLAEQYSNGTPVTVDYYAIETDLVTPHEEIVAYTTAQQSAWDNLQKLVTYGGETTITTTNAIKPVLSGKYYMDVPQLPLKIKNINGTVTIDTGNAQNRFDINGDVSQMYDGTTVSGVNTVVDGVLTTTRNGSAYHAVGQRVYVGTGNPVVASAKFTNATDPVTSSDKVACLLCIYQDNTADGMVYTSWWNDELNETKSTQTTAQSDYVYICFCYKSESCTSASFTDITVNVVENITLTEEQSIIITSTTKGEVIRATDLTVTPATEKQIFDGLYDSVIVEGLEETEEYAECLDLTNEILGGV